MGRTWSALCEPPPRPHRAAAQVSGQQWRAPRVGKGLGAVAAREGSICRSPLRRYLIELSYRACRERFGVCVRVCVCVCVGRKWDLSFIASTKHSHVLYTDMYPCICALKAQAIHCFRPCPGKHTTSQAGRQVSCL